jgi:hypothetical protein
MANIEYKEVNGNYVVRTGVKSIALYRKTKKSGYIKCVEAVLNQDELLDLLMFGKTNTLLIKKEKLVFERP